MTLNELSSCLEKFILSDSENCIKASHALREDLVGIRFFDAPLMGCTAANDPIFSEMKGNPVAYGKLLRLPEEWLPGAKSVISFFLPYSNEIKVSNREDGVLPSDEWLHARIEGQAFLLKACRHLAAKIESEGFKTVIPAISSDFFSARDDERMNRGEPLFVSNWSERHIAYAAGLGTFGLAKHLITEKGVCGRFGSIITDAALEPTPRKYTNPYEYCSFCGACADRCPMGAIAGEEKNNSICSEFINKVGKLFAPRYGCGRCQIGVPCEKGIPSK